MANRIEEVRDYLGSVAERTVGMRAYKEEIDGGAEKSTSVLAGVLQLVVPAAHRALTYYLGPDINKNLYPTYPKNRGVALFAAHLYSQLATDATLNYFVALNVLASQSFMEGAGKFIAYKLAANAATHVGLDIVGAAAKRVRNFRSSGTTLAV